jgi:hypothetical protein
LLDLHRTVGDNAQAELRFNGKSKIKELALDKTDIIGPSNDAIYKKLKPTSPMSISTEKPQSYRYTLQL